MKDDSCGDGDDGELGDGGEHGDDGGDYNHVAPPLRKGRLSPLQGLLHPRRFTLPSVLVDFPLG